MLAEELGTDNLSSYGEAQLELLQHARQYGERHWGWRRVEGGRVGVLVGGGSGMFWEKKRKDVQCVGACWCVCAGHSKWKDEENFIWRLQGKVPMWPKLPQGLQGGTALQAAAGSGSRSDSRRGAPVRRGQYVIAGFSVGSHAPGPSSHLPNPDPDQEARARSHLQGPV